MNCRIGKIEWFFVFVVCGVIDIVQVVLLALGVGAIVNTIITFVMSIIAGIYYPMRGVSLGKSAARTLISAIIEFVPVINALPAWTRHAFLTWSSVKAEKLASKAPIVGHAISTINKTTSITRPGQAAANAANTAARTAQNAATKLPRNPDLGIRIIGQSKQNLNNTPGQGSSGQGIVDGIRKAA